MWYTYGMRVVYQADDVSDQIGIKTAKIQMPLFGRWCELSFTCYSLRDDAFDLSNVAMGFGIQPITNHNDIVGSRLGGAQNGLLRMARGTGGNRQEFDQQFEFPLIKGQLFDTQGVDNSVASARDLVRSILRGVESMIETVRQSIRCQFHPEVRKIAITALDYRYGAASVRALRSFLGEIHWQLMFSNSAFDADQIACIEIMTKNNVPHFYDVNWDGESEIPLVVGFAVDILTNMKATVRMAHAARLRQEQDRQRLEIQAKLAVASDKARDLLRTVCGDDNADHFVEHGCIVVEQSGYRFVIGSNSFVKCTDPQGKTAELCIHTHGFNCNPIDEVVIAFLHIRHKLEDYMRLAVLHYQQAGFQRIPAKVA